MPDEEAIVFSPETFKKHSDAVTYVLGRIRTRDPLGRQKRFPRIIPGAWGKLAAGATITAASGLTLGSGTVKLCDREGAVADDAEDVDVSNAGAEFTAGTGGAIVPLEWTQGEWSTCICGETTEVCNICVQVSECEDDSPVSGATVKVYLGSILEGTCITNTSGNCCIAVTSSGTYRIEVTKTGYPTGIKSVAVTCPGVTAATIHLSVTLMLNVTVSGCGTDMGRCQTPTFIIGGYNVPGFTDGSLWHFPINLPNGTYSWTASCPPFYQPLSGTITVAECTSQGIAAGLVPTDDYICLTYGDFTGLVPRVLRYTDGSDSFLITYDGGIYWIGCGTRGGAQVRNDCANCGTIAGSAAYRVRWNPVDGAMFAIGAGGCFAPTYSMGTWSDCMADTVTPACPFDGPVTLTTGFGTTGVDDNCPQSFAAHGTWGYAAAHDGQGWPTTFAVSL